MWSCRKISMVQPVIPKCKAWHIALWNLKDSLQHLSLAVDLRRAGLLCGVRLDMSVIQSPPLLHTGCTWADTLHLTLYTPHSTLCTWHSTLYTSHSTLFILHFTLHTLHFTLETLHFHFALHTLHFTFHTFTPHSTLYTPQSKLYTLHFTLYTLHFTLHTLHLSPYTPHSTLYTPHSNFTQHTLNFTLFTLHFRIHTIHFALHAPDSSLYTLQSTLQTLHEIPHATLHCFHAPHSALRTIPHSTVYTGMVTGEECTRLKKHVETTCFTKVFCATAFGFVGWSCLFPSVAYRFAVFCNFSGKNCSYFFEQFLSRPRMRPRIKRTSSQTSCWFVPS